MSNHFFAAGTWVIKYTIEVFKLKKKMLNQQVLIVVGWRRVDSRDMFDHANI